MEDIELRNSSTDDRERKSSGRLMAVVVLVAVVVIVIFIGVKRFVAYGISSDITEYIRIVEQSNLEVDLKRDLQQRFESIRDRARRRRLVSFWVWMDYNESIRSLIEDGEITESDLAALNRELDRLESKR